METFRSSELVAPVLPIYSLARAENVPAGAQLAGAILAAAERPAGPVAVDGERRNDEELLRRLARAEHLAVLGQLAAGVAHEVNNAVAYASANLALARENQGRLGEAVEAVLASEPGEPRAGARGRLAELVSEAAEMLAVGIEGLQRVEGIVRGLRSFSRAEEVEIEPVDLGGLVQSTCQLLRSEIGQRARLTLDLSPVLPVPSNRAKLTQILINLLLNATQAIEEGAAARNEIRVALGSEGGQVRLAVEDTGCGIPLAIQPRIFEAFFTTKPGEQGTGLGLSISRDLARSLGGELHFTSVPGRGSCFTLTLPP